MAQQRQPARTAVLLGNPEKVKDLVKQAIGEDVTIDLLEDNSESGMQFVVETVVDIGNSLRCRLRCKTGLATLSVLKDGTVAILTYRPLPENVD